MFSLIFGFVVGFATALVPPARNAVINGSKAAWKHVVKFFNSPTDQEQ